MTNYQRTSETIFALIDADVVALHVDRGTCFGMENVSADVWQMLEHPVSVGEICSRLLDRYEVGADQCQAEVQRLIDQMVDEGLVRVAA